MDEFSVELPLRIHFMEVIKVLLRKTIVPSTPIVMKNWLLDLKYLLAECIISAEKERERKLLNKKNQYFIIHTMKKIWFLHKIRTKLLQIKSKLQNLRNNGSAAEGSSLSDTTRIYIPEYLPHPNSSEIHGFNDHLHKIETLLLETPDDVDAIKTIPDVDAIKAIGIVGMCGVGKTALAESIVSSSLVQEKFFPIIWVRLSRTINLPEIVKDLLILLGVSYQFVNNNTLPLQLKELHDQLCSHKYLIVLDNVWHINHDLSSNLNMDDTECFSHLFRSLPKGGDGAIIVTSRMEEVAISMVGEQNLLKLQPTFNAEAVWSIFMDSVQRKRVLDSYHHQRLLGMKDEIIYRCDGLPLAARVLAEIISTQIGKEEYWSDSNVEKEFCLRLDRPDVETYELALFKVRSFPGVHNAFSRPGHQIAVIGRCNPVEIAKELEIFLFKEIELISVDLSYIERREVDQKTVDSIIRIQRIVRKKLYNS
ncbi:putative disease resistance protein RGA1 isoform X2 [Cornus florida]|nr:putative disease resistance protein RGA1 isoform X2 [Cornus florida]XP_059623489.1 putative disease resistance protein RGA1 isoform X2 [Cornus florida]